MIAQSVSGTPGHINAMATGVKHFLRAFPPEGLEPGDVLVTNDPWMTVGQVNDITVVTPVFRGERPIAYFANACHSPDIGGRILSAEAAEVFEEGLQIPMMKLARAGVLNDDLIAIIRANVRTPDETMGDIHAQATANEAGARRLTLLLDELGLDALDPVADRIIQRSEDAMRVRIAEVPDGRYEHSIASDGFDAEELTLKVAITIEGDAIDVDFTGSSPQSDRGINVVLNYTHAYASFALKSALAPDVPHNEGSFRPVRVRAPERSILNCIRPAAVASRHTIGHLLPGLIFGALADAMPGRLLAGGSEALWVTVWRGTAEADEFTLTLFHQGGTGARATKDGLNSTGWPSSVGAVPAEVIETLTPLIQRRRALRESSGGAGRTRGGLGQVVEIENRTKGAWSFSALNDRTRHTPKGFEGGRDGALGEMSATGGRALPAKRLTALPHEAVVSLALPGGGGYGDPKERDPALVLTDVINGYITIDEARTLYGVVIRYVGAVDALLRLPEDFFVE